ncbi:hypothetical protein A2V61_01635 [Candidatus Woesebacteria bacterium RBG_19FT_COMBO_47_8]|uniref:Probable DNA 3'-5' helicase RecG n=1 Tax=Candidatus Woesebacteria bacterium RBG_13_46_13 TaxID=1802479 RepID=A0A1F7X3G6_9BACT|nr:MAG: hypothetical protein A2Y68_03220 [Candidatus Woesebacteria bacterium RBG_13_46_13]OGM17618.1 MAG: hypothetical protein A2V61_01635 [Candidatus Woesebacteria bacterium RBG_19FT_COMBO_47_8]HJX59574.1 ATP-dependent DNA helicase RecG [Patescibacteria group bacterium]
MYLNSPVEELPLVGPSYARRLNNLGIVSIKDLLYHVPHRYLDFRVSSPVRAAAPEDVLTIRGKVVSIKNQYTRSGRKIQIGEVEDASGKITVVWFNQPFLVRVLFPEAEISLAGKVGFFSGRKALISPEYELIKQGKTSIHTSGLVPIYPETFGLSSKWLRGRIAETLASLGSTIKETLPLKFIKSEGLIPLTDAIHAVHHPASEDEAEKGRQRLAFDELLELQLTSISRKAGWKNNQTGHTLAFEESDVDKFIDSLPFALTASQQSAVEEILGDLTRAWPMNRLLEGDVGSGKTVVAAIAAFVCFINGLQTAVMAPTQILAQQHYETLQRIFKPFKLRVALITSGLVKKDLGRTDIFVGTHALLNKKGLFENVGLVVIDEQHRFGVEQRALLVKQVGKKKLMPHILTMTATPIPRTVALTLYGDLDLSVLKELPGGRQKITTWIVPPAKRPKAMTWVKDEILKDKVQAFLICPLIEESDKETMQSVKAAAKEYAEQKKIFSELSFGLIHGKLSGKDKDRVMSDFRKGKIDVLVATPVVEVGIDVANATIMLIEGSERFGLAQLHQLRGRVGRGEKKSYCLIFSDSAAPRVLTRLAALEKGISGFELAELDLSLRGPGEVFGTRQHGFPELKIASWQDTELIQKAKRVAQMLSDKGFVLATKASMV